MKDIKSEIRMWLAEKLLGWAFDLTPYNEKGHKMRVYITNYYLDKIHEDTWDNF